MSKLVYPVVLHPNPDGGFTVTIPDLDISTGGDNLADSIVMARDAIGSLLLYLEDKKAPIPKPSATLPTCEGDDMSSFVDIDPAEYRRSVDFKSIRKNVTVPAYICYKAEQANINFSQVLQEALKVKLSI